MKQLFILSGVALADVVAEQYTVACSYNDISHVATLHVCVKMIMMLIQPGNGTKLLLGSINVVVNNILIFENTCEDFFFKLKE